MAGPGPYSPEDEFRLATDPHDGGRPGRRIRLGAGRRRALSEREELLCVLSHEFRTPLTVISGYLRLLLSESRSESSPNQRRLIEAAVDHCGRLDRFMADLIDVSHAGVLEAALDQASRPLAQVIEEARRLLGPVLSERSVRLEVDIDPAAEWALFDATRVVHVLTNLITNAMKVTRPGGLIRIRTGRIETEGGPFVETTVIDQGPGVAVADRERIFEPFTRGSAGTPAEGTGIGLALCRRIVEAHGGEIRIADDLNRGSRFVFTLPASSGVAEQDFPPSAGMSTKAWMAN